MLNARALCMDVLPYVLLLGACLSLTGCKGSGGGDHVHSQSSLQLLNLSRSPLARCLDGTPAGYYWKPATSPNSTSWMLHFQGGGECAGEESCHIKAKSNLGSSKFFPATYTWEHYLVNDLEALNPDFHDWHMVFLPYCSQDLWSGQRIEANNTTFGLYFSGHHIIKAILDELERYPVQTTSNPNWSLAKASNIVVTGASAGGFAVYANIDDIASRYPTAKVVGAPIAGFEFYGWKYLGPGHTPDSKYADFSMAAMTANVELWQNAMSKECLAAHPGHPGACLLMCAAPPYAWKFIKSRLFIIEAQSDSVVLISHDNFPPKPSPSGYNKEQLQYLKDFHSNQTACLTDAMDAANRNVGVFNPACFMHTAFKNSIHIGGISYRTAFGDFFFQRGDPPKLQDDCGELCNPTCHSPLHVSLQTNTTMVV